MYGYVQYVCIGPKLWIEKVNKPAKIQDFGDRSSGSLILNSRLNKYDEDKDLRV